MRLPYLARKAIQLAGTLLAVVTFNFVLFRILPGDPIRLYARSGHLTPEAVGQMASRANVKTVVLTHLTYRPPPNAENYAPWVEEVKKHFSGHVLVAKDLMEF